MKGFLKLQGVFDCQLKQPQSGRDDLVLRPVVAQQDELEVRVHCGLVIEKDATLQIQIKNKIHFKENVRKADFSGF